MLSSASPPRTRRRGGSSALSAARIACAACGRIARLQAAAAAGLHESPQRQAMRRSRPAAGLGKNVSNDQGDALPSKLAIDSNQTATIAVMTADVTSASMCRVRL
jgi:hypothetical protein